MRAGVSSFMLMFSLYVPTHVMAVEPVTQDTDSGCIEVEVNGKRVPSFSCLTQKLQPAPNALTQSSPPRMSGSEAIINRPSNQLDVVNQAATSHRMGNTFGTSVTPQRPAKIPPFSPFPQK